MNPLAILREWEALFPPPQVPDPGLSSLERAVRRRLGLRSFRILIRTAQGLTTQPPSSRSFVPAGFPLERSVLGSTKPFAHGRPPALLWPLRSDDECLGCLLFEGPLDRGKRELAAALADRAVLYLRERKLWDELGLSNRRSLLGWVAPGLVHEIKNPLTALSALVQLAPVKLTDPQFQASFFPVLKREIERILERTHHWQDFIRPLDPKASVFRLDQAVEQVLRLARPLFLERQVVLEQDLQALSLKGCPDQVESLVLNLLLNSLNASKKGGRVWVELRKAKGRGPWLELSVRDEGKGIEPSRLGRIFEPYHSTGPQGTGLGLFLSRRIAENHGGTLNVKSSPGKGALFTLRLRASA